MNILKERGFEMNLYLKLEYDCKGGMMGAPSSKFKSKGGRFKCCKSGQNKIITTIHE
jgi:hypothetical protein